jgi:cytochrome c
MFPRRLRALPAFIACIVASAPPAARAQHSWPGCEEVKPADFRKVPFLDKAIHPGLHEPIKMVFAKDGRFFWIERPGAIKRWDPATRSVVTLAQLKVHLENTRGGMGITLDPDFASNGFVYVVYMPDIAPYGLFRLSRLTLTGDRLLNEKIVLDVPITVGMGQHASGAMAWDNQGNLFWGLGDNSKPSNYGALSNTVAGEDSRRTSGSSDNLNGKILRIRPEPDGTYSIPAGNMFSPVLPRYAPHAAGNLRHGFPQSLVALVRQADGLALRRRGGSGRGRRRRKPGSRGPGRDQYRQGPRKLWVAVRRGPQPSL